MTNSSPIKVKVAFQGEPGAYSEASLLEFFNHNVDAIGKNRFEDVFEDVENGTCQYGFIPIENSLAGSIHRNYDLLREHKLCIIGETNLRIRHCLIAAPGTTKEQIRLVKSHPQALDQCRGYLNRWKGITIEPVYDTAGAVKQLSENRDQITAAIASRRAAEIYGMTILEEGLEDDTANFTRFLVLSTDPVDPGEDAKTSIVFSLINQPGSLFKALSVFALRDIDLTKMESRPLIGQPGEYLFYIDFAGSTSDKKRMNALNHLEEYATFLRVLGSYPRHPFS
ncbi:MAG: prephenate dehydratase [Chloroflexi bacterium]|nr:prephenate dehydratase [Chloroflexota bacterium]